MRNISSSEIDVLNNLVASEFCYYSLHKLFTTYRFRILENSNGQYIEMPIYIERQVRITEFNKHYDIDSKFPDSKNGTVSVSFYQIVPPYGLSWRFASVSNVLSLSGCPTNKDVLLNPRSPIKPVWSYFESIVNSSNYIATNVQIPISEKRISYLSNYFSGLLKLER